MGVPIIFSPLMHTWLSDYVLCLRQKIKRTFLYTEMPLYNCRRCVFVVYSMSSAVCVLLFGHGNYGSNLH